MGVETHSCCAASLCVRILANSNSATTFRFGIIAESSRTAPIRR